MTRASHSLGSSLTAPPSIASQHPLCQSQAEKSPPITSERKTTIQAPNLGENNSKSRQSDAKKQPALCMKFRFMPSWSNRPRNHRHYWQVIMNWRKKDSATTPKKTTLGEALGWRGGGEEQQQQQQRVEEEEAGGHTMGVARCLCRPAEGRELAGWKGSAVGRLVGALFCSVAACLLALGTAVDSDGELFLCLHCSGASSMELRIFLGRVCSRGMSATVQA